MSGTATARVASPSGWASLVQLEASANHPHATALLRLTDAEATRSAADMLHHLCTVHGRHPGVIEHAATSVSKKNGAGTLDAVAQAFAHERDYLARLVVAAGPLPSTPGQAESMGSVVAARHAIDMLGQSEREGVAAGAALALALDWVAVRPVLDAAAARFAIAVPATRLPEIEALVALADALCATPASQRAFAFGAQQIAAQHRGLWNLLEARARARLDN